METKTNVSAAHVNTKRGSTAFIKLVIDLANIEQLSFVMKAIRAVPDVYDVYRSDIIKKNRSSNSAKK